MKIDLKSIIVLKHQKKKGNALQLANTLKQELFGQ